MHDRVDEGTRGTNQTSLKIKNLISEPNLCLICIQDIIII